MSEKEDRYKCFSCFTIFNKSEMENKECCPACGEDKMLKKMCENDGVCTCLEDVHSGVKYCDKCGEPICPCGGHNNLVVTRVTGYLQSLEGFNAGKRQEVKDRHRTNIE